MREGNAVKGIGSRIAEALTAGLQSQFERTDDNKLASVVDGLFAVADAISDLARAVRGQPEESDKESPPEGAEPERAR